MENPPCKRTLTSPTAGSRIARGPDPVVRRDCRVYADAMVVTTLPNIPVVTKPIELAGTLKGEYHAKEIPDAGKFYKFSGSGRVSPLGGMHVRGTVDLPGLLIHPITPVAVGATANPISLTPQATGELVLSSSRGESHALAVGAVTGRRGNAPGLLQLHDHERHGRVPRRHGLRQAPDRR